MNRDSILSVLIITLAMSLAMPARAQNPLKQISVDKFTNSDSIHKTEVEPDTYSFGSTIVSTHQVGRRPGTLGFGSADIGFSTSTDGGTNWTFGYLPGLTVNYKGGTFYAASDPSVAFDAKHGMWMISYLPLVGNIGDVGVSLSADAIHWGNPVIIDSSQNDDKNWTVCDNTSTSPFYGNCYTEWDNISSGNILMSTSGDGGMTWGAGKPTANHAGGLGGQPLVQPSGTVIVPFQFGAIDAFTSTNGGQSWNKSVLVANITSHLDAGGIRNPNLPSAEIDAAGTVYVVWSDCRFRTGCSANDIVMSTSADGVTWTAPARIPIDPTSSTVDHFIPGIGVDHNTSGASAHLALVYYYYPVSNCTAATCQLDVGFVTSEDGGKTWTAGQQLAGPMHINWLPNTDLGPMVADYISVSYTNGNPFGVFAVAKTPSGGLLNEAMYTNRSPLLTSPGAPRFSSAGDKPVSGAKSDHEARYYYDDEGHYPIPQSRLDQQQK